MVIIGISDKTVAMLKTTASVIFSVYEIVLESSFKNRKW